MEQVKIKCVDIDKSYGNIKVLNHVNIECQKGKITGIVGRNGAGKTVLFKAICGLITVDDGDIYIDHVKRKNNGSMLESVGLIIEEPAFLTKESGLKNLEYLYIIRNKNNRAYLKEVMKKVGLDAESKKHVEKYSMGMRQRLAIAQAIMENPDILILDEPFNGLDNQGVNEMRKLIINIRNEGKTILVASHNSDDIKLLCDTVYEMDKGILIKIS